MEDNKILRDFAAKFRKSKQVAACLADEYLRKNDVAQVIEDFNREQLAKGKDSNDEELGDYSEWRTRERIIAGKQIAFIDLKFRGEFYDNIFASSKLASAGCHGAKKAVLVMGNTDPKLADINADSRFKDAIGLNEKNRDKVAFMIATHIQKELIKYYTS